MRFAVRGLLVVFIAVLCVGTVLAQEAKTPKVEGFQLDGEQWTCTYDGKSLSGLLLKPEGAGPFPAIILSHGLGGNAQTMMRTRGSELVKWGFVCIATDYTHAGKGGGGRGNRDGVDFTQAGARPENIRRGLVCLEILRQRKDVDPKRIALYGHSMGAFLTIALAAAAPDKVAAAAITAGGVITAGYSAAAAPTVEVADRVRAPFLILHGTADTTVAPQSSERLKQSLDSHGVPNARHLFEGVGHGLPTEKSDEVNRVMREWFAKNGVLRGAPSTLNDQGAQPPVADARGQPLCTIGPADLEAARSYSESVGGQAMVVMFDGQIVFEAYGNGGAIDRPQMLASGSKSFVGVAALAAIEDGIIRLDDPASEALTEWKSDPQKAGITYRHLLTLTSGLLAGERGAAVRSPAWKEIITKPMNGEAGRQFEYGAYHLNVFCEALERKLGGESFESYLKRRVFDPVGVKVDWAMRCADGHPQVGGGARMTARDWATFGEFVRLAGVWKGKPIIRPDLFPLLTQGTQHNPAYGLTWWLKETVPESLIRQVPILQRDMGDIVKSEWLPEDLFLAAGAGKQRLYISPSMKLIIVRQGELMGSRNFSDAEFLNRLLRSGLPPAV